MTFESRSRKRHCIAAGKSSRKTALTESRKQHGCRAEIMWSIAFQIQSENARGKGLGNLACLPAGKRRVLMVKIAILEELPRGVDFGTGFLVDSMTFETQPENARGIRLQSR